MSERIPQEKFLGTRYVTDGVYFGVVKHVTESDVCIVDRNTRLHHVLPGAKVRRMTRNEFYEWNAKQGLHDPAPEEITSRSLEVQKKWTEDERRIRLRPNLKGILNVG